MTAQQTFRNTLVVVLTLALAYTLWASARILIVLLVAIIVASAVRPAVVWLHRRRLPEGLAILLVYLMLGLGIFLLGVVILPPAVNQFAGYIENEQGLATRIIEAQNWFHQQIFERTGQDVTLLDPGAIRTTITTSVEALKKDIPALAGEFGGLLGDFVLAVVMGVYWLTSRDQAINFMLQLFPIGRRAETAEIIHETEHSMGAYVRGIVLVVTFVGVANFIILSLLGVPNAVTLGFIVGITTALPIIGGYIGAATATILALLSSPLHALFAFGSFVLVQQVENHYLTPVVMSRSVNLNPILIIVFLFIGFALGGVIGALISVPIAGTLNILIRHLVVEPRKSEATPQFVEGGILIPEPKPKDVKVGTGIVTPETAKGSNTAS
jgi:predicted PurR-regulated permease PerM